MTDDALALAMRIVDDDLDRLDALDRSTGRRTTPPHELDQLGAQIVVQRLMEAHANQAALVRSKTEPAVTQDRDMHTAADQPPRAIRATQTAAPIGAKRVLGVCRDAGIRHLGGIARGVRRQSAQGNRNAHEGSLFRSGSGKRQGHRTPPTVRSPVRPSQDDLTPVTPPPGPAAP